MKSISSDIHWNGNTVVTAKSSGAPTMTKVVNKLPMVVVSQSYATARSSKADAEGFTEDKRNAFQETTGSCITIAKKTGRRTVEHLSIVP